MTLCTRGVSSGTSSSFGLFTSISLSFARLSTLREWAELNYDPAMRLREPIGQTVLLVVSN